MFVSSLLAASALLYAAGVVRLWRTAGRGQGIARAQAAAFAASCVALAVALSPPVDEWSDRLFAAHMAQHELLILVAAPLAALGAPLIAFLWALPSPTRRSIVSAIRRPAVVAIWAALTAPATVWILHAVALWIWHLPSLYDAALESETIHAFQHLSFFGTAALFWYGMAHGRYGRSGYGVAVLYIFATAVHSGVLGALLAFSPHLWYPHYASTARAFGLTPLEDQQLAGLLMWVPGSIVFVAGGLFFFGRWVRASSRRPGPRALSAAARRVVVPVVAVVLAGGAAASAGCSQSPEVKRARLLERAASWAASVQVAGDLRREGRVPDAYLREVLATGADELQSIAKSFDEVGDGANAGVCRKASALLRRAHDSGELSGLSALRASERQWRDAARKARGAAMQARR